MEKTLGEKRVRTSFNPDNNGVVDEIKQKSAELINLVESLREKKGDSFEEGLKYLDSFEKGRLLSLAQTSFEEAAMWAVKAATL